MRACVILLNHNGWRNTLECLESVFRSTHADYEVVVVDNASTDHSVRCIREWADGRRPAVADHALRHLVEPPVAKPVALHVLANAQNLGYGAGNNVGLRFALERGIDGAWLLNNDVLVAPDALSQLVEYADSRAPRPAITGPMVHRFDRPDRIRYAGGGR